jgi:hypothetical protein
LLPIVRLVRQPGLYAAALLVLALAASASGCAGAQARAAHTCSATDRAFISTADVNMTALGMWTDEYQSGDVEASDLIAQARKAERILEQTQPSDPALQQTRKLMDSMLVEYRKAISARERQRDPSRHMYRAYGLASFARDVLQQAQPALQSRGCDVKSLL